MPGISSFKKMNINRWIPFDPVALDEVKEKSSKKGAHLQISLNPFDIPVGVRGHYCASRKKFIIEIKYLSEEPTITKRVSTHIECLEGQNSGRLYGLMIDADAMNVDEISVAVRNGIETARREEASSPHRSRLNERILMSIDANVPDLVKA